MRFSAGQYPTSAGDLPALGITAGINRWDTSLGLIAGPQCWGSSVISQNWEPLLSPALGQFLTSAGNLLAMETSAGIPSLGDRHWDPLLQPQRQADPTKCWTSPSAGFTAGIYCWDLSLESIAALALVTMPYPAGNCCWNPTAGIRSPPSALAKSQTKQCGRPASSRQGYLT